MTLARARQLARRWIVCAAVAAILRTALASVGIDLVDLPLGIGQWVAFAFAMRWRGWVLGYASRDRTIDAREDA